jgi:hypothetical protein
MSDPHAAKAAVLDDEPKTPMWLPALGAALFVTVGLWWAVTPSTPPVSDDGQAPSESASAAAAAPSLRPTPPPIQTQAPIQIPPPAPSPVAPAGNAPPNPSNAAKRVRMGGKP